MIEKKKTWRGEPRQEGRGDEVGVKREDRALWEHFSFY